MLEPDIDGEPLGPTGPGLGPAGGSDAAGGSACELDGEPLDDSLVQLVEQHLTSPRVNPMLLSPVNPVNPMLLSPVAFTPWMMDGDEADKDNVVDRKKDDTERILYDVQHL